MELITMDTAINALIRLAEEHEAANDAEGHCVEYRSELTAHVMLALGLELEDIGLVAVSLIECQVGGGTTDEWPDNIDGHGHNN